MILLYIKKQIIAINKNNNNNNNKDQSYQSIVQYYYNQNRYGDRYHSSTKSIEPISTSSTTTTTTIDTAAIERNIVQLYGTKRGLLIYYKSKNKIQIVFTIKIMLGIYPKKCRRKIKSTHPYNTLIPKIFK